VVTFVRFTRTLLFFTVVAVLLLARFATAGGANASKDASATPAKATRNARTTLSPTLKPTLLDAKRAQLTRELPSKTPYYLNGSFTLTSISIFF
jgi:hypothetical protein